MKTPQQTDVGGAGSFSARQGSEQRPVQLFAFVVAAGVSALLSVWFAMPRLGRPANGPEVVLQGTINPNTAPAVCMARLPGIGPSKAAAIVAYRQSFSADEETAGAFEDCADLQKVRGIGPKTAGGICEFLRFD